MHDKTDEPVLDKASLLGTWCYYQSYWLGVVVADEFTFSDDQKFVWRKFKYDEKADDFDFVRNSGVWELDDGILKLDIQEREDRLRPHYLRVHFAAYLRSGEMFKHPNGIQLVLSPVLKDDKVLPSKRGEFFPFKAAPGEADEHHAQLRAKRKRGNKVDGPFKDLVSLLIKEVPASVGRLEIEEPLFCVRLFFHDTHAPAEGFCAWVKCLGESARQRIVQKERPIDVPDCLWHPTAGIANDVTDAGNGVYEADLSQNMALMELYGQIYQLLEESEDENVPKLRAALRRVALALHMIKWPANLSLTDDFVVFPADGSNFFAGEYEQDMKASVPSKRLALLAERGYLRTP